MKKRETKIDGVYLVKNIVHEDERGSFSKIFNEDLFRNLGLNNEFKENFYSTSKKDVIRGMHFQLPPHDHDKLVYVLSGSIIDVVLDLRKNSLTYGSCDSFTIHGGLRDSVFIPKGCAHGFLSLQDETTVGYLTSSCYNPESDSGICWDSIPYDWGLENPVVSERDSKLIELTKFDSPF